MRDYLRRLIASQLEERVKKLLNANKIKVVAVTGSVGKTSTKLAIAHVLKAKYKVLAHEGNYNSEIGLPLSIFEVDVPKLLVNPLEWLQIIRQIDSKLSKPFPYHVLVLEMGADQPGDIQKFMHYIQPDIGVITAIQPAHLEGFGSFKNIETEKMALAHGSKQVLINAEDEGVVRASKNLKYVKTYGLSKADFVLPKIELKVPGEPARLAAAAAYAVGQLLDVPKGGIESQLETLTSFKGRMNVLEGKRGSTIIDDTYNASPPAVIAALDTLYGWRGGRKIAILGNMNELGSYAQKAHEEVGAACGKLDMLLTIGNISAEYLASAAEGAGLKPDQIHRFLSPYEAGLYLDDRLKKDDVVLAKGSQNGVFAEEAVALLLKNPNDRNKLVRQGHQWERRKRESFGLE